MQTRDEIEERTRIIEAQRKQLELNQYDFENRLAKFHKNASAEKHYLQKTIKYMRTKIEACYE